MSATQKSSGVAGLHNDAMAAAEDAMRMKNSELKRQMFARAYNCERAAACIADQEPSRSVLWRSAATLALDTGEPMWALNCVYEGLHRCKHSEIRAEFADVLDRISKHLRGE